MLIGNSYMAKSTRHQGVKVSRLQGRKGSLPLLAIRKVEGLRAKVEGRRWKGESNREPIALRRSATAAARFARWVAARPRPLRRPSFWTLTRDTVSLVVGNEICRGVDTTLQVDTFMASVRGTTTLRGEVSTAHTRADLPGPLLTLLGQPNFGLGWFLRGGPGSSLASGEGL